MQASLLRAWKSLDSLREDGAAKHWLLTIVRRENARYFERKRLETVDVDNLTPSQEALLATAPDEERDELRAAIYRLDELMGLKQGAVFTRLHRARHKLPDEMMEEAATGQPA